MSFDKAVKVNLNIMCANLLNVMFCSMERDKILKIENTYHTLKFRIRMDAFATFLVLSLCI